MYASAHSHVAIGDVLAETPLYLTLLCKTYHFGHGVGTKKAVLVPNACVGGIVEGEKGVRSIPWSQIEVINELPADTDWDVRALVEESGVCLLLNAHKTVVTRSMTARQE
jgi:chemotaxis signal transduction protein